MISMENGEITNGVTSLIAYEHEGVTISSHKFCEVNSSGVKMDLGVRLFTYPGPCVISIQEIEDTKENSKSFHGYSIWDGSQSSARRWDDTKERMMIRNNPFRMDKDDLKELEAYQPVQFFSIARSGHGSGIAVGAQASISILTIQQTASLFAQEGKELPAAFKEAFDYCTAHGVDMRLRELAQYKRDKIIVQLKELASVIPAHEEAFLLDYIEICKKHGMRLASNNDHQGLKKSGTEIKGYVFQQMKKGKLSSFKTPNNNELDALVERAELLGTVASQPQDATKKSRSL